MSITARSMKIISRALFIDLSISCSSSEIWCVRILKADGHVEPVVGSDPEKPSIVIALAPGAAC